MITKAHLNVAVLIIIIHCVVQQVTNGCNYTLYSVDCEVHTIFFSIFACIFHFKPYPNKILKHFSHFFKLCNLGHFCL